MRRATAVAVMLAGWTALAGAPPLMADPEEDKACEDHIKLVHNCRDGTFPNPEKCEAYWQPNVDACRKRFRAKKQREAENVAAEAKQHAEWQAEQERKQHEADAAAKAQAEEDATVESIKANKKLMGAIFGAGFCLIRRYRDSALREIATQKKYSRLGGVQNNLQLMSLQNAIRRADELEAKDRADLKGYKGVVPMACTKPEVVLLMTCRESDDDATNEACRTGRVPLMTSLVTDPRADEDE